jgi:hypothetical protein
MKHEETGDSRGERLDSGIKSRSQAGENKFSSIGYIAELLRKDGILTFYKGLNSALIGTVLSYGIYFWWYRLFKNLFQQMLDRKEFSDLDITIITFVSGMINSILTSPIWFINTRMAISTEKKSIW